MVEKANPMVAGQLFFHVVEIASGPACAHFFGVCGSEKKVFQHHGTKDNTGPSTTKQQQE